ncbi:MAG TPA: glycoside hydrolase family 3 C-terminal domain-containing protein, partial [Pseudolysinimonas sp.]|nr:glycoside hydrolase family 3 C-terminal domain-containing protein [Pseudolysinimonas sp.]
EQPAASVVFDDAHRALSREAASRAMTLVKNDAVDGSPVLPIDPAKTTSIALIGRLATVANTGDHGSSDVRTPHVVTAEEGLRSAFRAATITVVDDDAPEAAARAAAAADVALVVAGYTADDEGEYVGQEMFTLPQLQALYPPAPEGVSTGLFFDDTGNIVGGTGAGGDRASLRLRPVDAEIIRAVAAANPRTVVAVVAAGAVITEEWRDRVPAVLFSWYAGSEGGHALADVLTGAVDASGRLPFSVPTDETHLPFFDRDATAITYDRWFGQRLLDRDGHAAAFPLGWGLSYTAFTIADLEVGAADAETIPVSVTVTNTGPRAGRHVVQVYGCPIGAADFPARVLLGFAPVALGSGESATVRIAASTRPLQRWTDAGFAPASSRVRVEAAAFAGDPDAPAAEVAL